MLLQRRGRLDDAGAFSESHLTVGVADDLVPGIAKKLLAGGILPNFRFLTIEFPLLFFEPALRPLVHLPPFPQREGSAVPAQGAGRLNQQVLVAGPHEVLLLKPVEILPHPLLRHPDPRLPFGQRRRHALRISRPTLGLLRQALPAKRYRPQRLLLNRQGLPHSCLDLLEAAVTSREAQPRISVTALPERLPKQRRAERCRDEIRLAAGEVRLKTLLGLGDDHVAGGEYRCTLPLAKPFLLRLRQVLRAE